jgi:hypothetical protein
MATQTQTDPARELSDLCESLRAGADTQRGHAFLAQRFGVEPWSTDFYQILVAIKRRIDDLTRIVPCLGLDDDLCRMALSNLARIGLAFSESGVNGEWRQVVGNFLGPADVRPIAMLSPSVRNLKSFPKLSADEQADLVAMVDELLAWLREHQLAEQDFIRQAIIDGLQQFRFSLEHLQWVGWGYTIQTLRDVIGAYLALEQGAINPNGAPDAQAMHMKVGATIRAIFNAVGLSKEVVERANFIFQAYKWGATIMVTQNLLQITGPTHGYLHC